MLLIHLLGHLSLTAASQWFLQPTTNIVKNGSEETRVHCSTKSKANQVTWFFQPADDFNWITVKAFPSQDYVTIYDKYTRYSVNEGITSVDNQMVYAYDLVISPVAWEDRGRWKCEVDLGSMNGLKTSAIGDLEIEMPLTSVDLETTDFSGSILVDKDDDVQIKCSTSATYPAPNGIEILIGSAKLSNIQIQEQRSGSLTKLTAIGKLNNVPVDYQNQRVTCSSSWTGTMDTAEFKDIASLTVFHAPESLSISASTVKYGQLLVATCNERIKGNPTPTFEWRLDGRFMGNGKTLEAKVSEKDDRKVLECSALHQPLKGATQRVKTTSQIRVQYPPAADSLRAQQRNSGDLVEVTCQSGTSFPAVDLEILLSSELAEAVVLPQDQRARRGGFSTSRKVTLPKTAGNHNRKITCVQSWGGGVFKQSVEELVKVEHAPRDVRLVLDDVIKVGENRIGCTAIGGYPSVLAADVSFFKGDEILKSKKKAESDSVFTVINLDKSDHGKELSCQLRHPDLKTPLKVATSLDVTFSPEELKITMNKPIYKIDETMKITVDISPTYPLPKVTCTKTIFSGESIELNPTSSIPSPALPYGFTVSTEFDVIASFLDHEATISCTAGTQTVEQVLSVLTKPTFINDRVFEVKEGEEEFKINLFEVIRANPPITEATWRRAEARSRSFDATNGILLLKKITKNTAGEYFIDSGKSGVSGTIQINVLTAPEITIDGVTELKKGDKLTLECIAEGFPTPNVEWIDEFGNQIDTDGILVVNEIARLSEFTCKASNSHSTRSVTTKVTVAFPPKVSAIEPRVLVLSDDNNNIVRISCEVSAEPAVKSLQFISPSGIATFGHFDGEVWSRDLDHLSLMNNFGVWTCVGENEFGKSQADINVVKAGPPEKVKNLRLNEHKGTSGMLTWTNGFDNGYEQKFRVQLKSADRIEKFSTVRTQVPLMNLTAQEYTATVWAVNEKGSSIPVELSFNASPEALTGGVYAMSYGIGFVLLFALIVVAIFLYKGHRQRGLKYPTKPNRKLNLSCS